MSGDVLVLLLISVVGSVLITWLLPMALSSKPPYGLAADIGVGTTAGTAFALLDYLVLAPMIGLSGWLALIISAGDAIGLAAVMLWVLRRIGK